MKIAGWERDAASREEVEEKECVVIIIILQVRLTELYNPSEKRNRFA